MTPKTRRGPTRLLLALATAPVALVGAHPASAQLADVFAGVRNGGGWVGIPIVAGFGSLSSRRGHVRR